jgi:hypothetical protein
MCTDFFALHSHSYPFTSVWQLHILPYTPQHGLTAIFQFGFIPSSHTHSILENALMRTCISLNISITLCVSLLSKIIIPKILSVNKKSSLPSVTLHIMSSSYSCFQES